MRTKGLLDDVFVAITQTYYTQERGLHNSYETYTTKTLHHILKARTNLLLVKPGPTTKAAMSDEMWFTKL